MTKKRRIFDIDLPEDDNAAPETKATPAFDQLIPPFAHLLDPDRV